MNTLLRKSIIVAFAAVTLISASVILPGAASAQITQSCTTDAQCQGPKGVCVNAPLGENAANKNCRNYFCDTSSSTTTSIQIVDANGQPTGSTVLKRGQSVKITSKANTVVNKFFSAFYNLDNLYGPNNPKGIETNAAHLQKYSQTVPTSLPNGNVPLNYGPPGRINDASYTMSVPWEFFITPDLNAGAGGKIATNIQVNSYFAIEDPYRLSMPESSCVNRFTVEADAYSCTSDAMCAKYPNAECRNNRCEPKPTAAPPTTAPSNASCPAQSACTANKTCACNTGYTNCDNNWTNGCETQGKCQQGGVCTDNNQCGSGVCKDRICQPGPTKVPNGGSCSSSDQCESGSCVNGKCAPVEPTKVPAGGSCTESSLCQSGYACTNGKCMPTYCDGTKPCPAGYTCKQGACFPGSCSAQNPCPQGYTCNGDKVCMPGKCTADTPCPPGYTCESDGSCKKSTGAGSCTGDAECKTNGQCVNGSCFCKQGSYNCDRDWTNGCEASSPCAGSGVARLTIRVKFNGIGRNIKPIVESERVKITLANKYLQAPVEREAEFRIVGEAAQGIRVFEGTVDFGNIPLGGDYTVLIKGGHHIQKRICDNDPTETVDGRYNCTIGKIRIEEGQNTLDFSKIYTLAGDLPVGGEQSGAVDAVDITFIRSNFGSKDPNELRVGDLNFDGIIDTQDYQLAIFTLSFKYDDTVTGVE